MPGCCDHSWPATRAPRRTGHVYGIHVVLISNGSWEKLPPDLQQILEAEIRAITPEQRALNKKLDEEATATLTTNGMTIHEIDKAAVQAKMAELMPTFEERFGKELVDRIRAEAK